MAQAEYNNDYDNRQDDEATGLRDRLGGTVEGAPLATLAGALAFGAAAAALIPITQREKAAIGPVGRKLRGYAGEAMQAAKSAGAEHLTAKGLTTMALTSGVGQAAGHFITAALAATNAAGQTVRNKRGQSTQPNQGMAQSSTMPQGETVTG